MTSHGLSYAWYTQPEWGSPMLWPISWEYTLVSWPPRASRAPPCVVAPNAPGPPQAQQSRSLLMTKLRLSYGVKLMPFEVAAASASASNRLKLKQLLEKPQLA